MATTLAERTTVAKKKGRPKGDRNDGPVKLDKTIIGLAKAVALTRGITVAEYLTGITSAPVHRDYAKTLEDIKKKGAAE